MDKNYLTNEQVATLASFFERIDKCSIEEISQFVDSLDIDVAIKAAYKQTFIILLEQISSLTDNNEVLAVQLEYLTSFLAPLMTIESIAKSFITLATSLNGGRVNYIADQDSLLSIALKTLVEKGDNVAPFTRTNPLFKYERSAQPHLIDITPHFDGPNKKTSGKTSNLVVASFPSPRTANKKSSLEVTDDIGKVEMTPLSTDDSNVMPQSSVQTAVLSLNKKLRIMSMTKIQADNYGRKTVSDDSKKEEKAIVVVVTLSEDPESQSKKVVPAAILRHLKEVVVGKKPDYMSSDFGNEDCDDKTKSSRKFGSPNIISKVWGSKE